MQLKTILNRVAPYKSFVYGKVRWVEDAAQSTLQVEIEPRAEGKSALTAQYRWFLARWAQRMSWQEVAEAFHFGWDRGTSLTGVTCKVSLKQSYIFSTAERYAFQPPLSPLSKCLKPLGLNRALFTRFAILIMPSCAGATGGLPTRVRKSGRSCTAEQASSGHP